MIDIEHGALRALEQDAVAALARLVEKLPDGLDVGRDLRRDLAQLRKQLRAVDLIGAHAAEQRVVMQQQRFDLRIQRGGIEQVADADGAARDLVLIGRADAAAGCADLARAARFFAQQVELAVQRQDERGVLGNRQDLRRHLDALPAQSLDLLQQGPGIHHHAVADDGELAAHQARGQQAQLVGLVADDEGMAGIVAALEAHHHVGAFRQPVDDLALALVAPLRADDRYIRHA